MWSISAYMHTSCFVQILKFGSTAAGLALVSWNNAIKALFIRDLCAALDRTHTMTPITTRRTATAVAPKTTVMTRTSEMMSSLVVAAASIALLKLFRIGRSSKIYLCNYVIHYAVILPYHQCPVLTIILYMILAYN